MKEVLFMAKEKGEKKGLFDFLKRPAKTSSWCDLKIVEVDNEENKDGNKGCAEFNAESNTEKK